jgi:hypothetical protein
VSVWPLLPLPYADSSSLRDYWGSLVGEENSNQSIFEIIYYRVAEVITQLPTAQIRHKAATTALLKKLSHVRAVVLQECRAFHESSSEPGNDQPIIDTDPSSNTNEDGDLRVLLQRRRLLFLFVKDLSSGVSGEALSAKSERDCSVGLFKARARLEGVSWRWQYLSWVFVLLLNGGLLFYVYLFALRQTHSRQSAWFHSFVMWLLFEVIVSSTGLVLLTHLFVPFFVMADVSRLKERVLGDLIKLRKVLLGALRDIEEGVAGGRAAEGDGFKSFNAAKYLFPSWQLACLFPELPESKLIMLFSTPWPMRKFGETGGAVSAEYEQAVILTALSRILLFFLGSLLRFHTLVQDILLQTICNSGLGFIVLGMVHLFVIHPALPATVGVLLLLVLYGLLRVFSGKGGLALLSSTPEGPLTCAPPLAGQPAIVSSEEPSNPRSPLSIPTLTGPLAPPPGQSLRYSPPSEMPFVPSVDERVAVSGAGVDDETNQAPRAGEEIPVWSNENEEVVEMASFRESSSSSDSRCSGSSGSSGSDDSKESSDSSVEWDTQGPEIVA